MQTTRQEDSMNRMTHEELVAKRDRYKTIPFDSRANAEKIRETGRDLWGSRALLTEAQRKS